MYNVGDKVRVIGGIIKVGEIVTIERNFSTSSYYVRAKDDKVFWVDSAMIKNTETLYAVKSITKTGNIELNALKQQYRVDTFEEVKALWYTFKISTKPYYDLLKVMSLMEKEKELEGATTVFKVGDNVVVIDGFYTGFKGKVIQVNLSVVIPDGTQWHQIMSSNGNKVNVSEVNLQKENNTMKLNLKNGTVIEGTPEEVTRIAKLIGVDLVSEGYYNSSTHGLIKISDMDTRHVQNALLKHYRTWVESLSTLTGKDLLRVMQDGPKSPEFNNLLSEFAKRASK